MLIRSQDKEKIINFNNVTEIFRFARPEFVEVKCALVDGEVTTIGKYSTKEKVIKILEIIASNYSTIEFYKMLSNEHKNKCIDAEPDKMTKLLNSIFQMPQEEEI